VKERKTWRVDSLLKVAADYLKEKKIESPRLSADILLAHHLNLNRVGLYLNYDRPLGEEEIAGFRSLLRRRLSGEPVAYITGRKEFWSMDFLVGPQVLIPRPETELLVEQALAMLRKGQIPVDEKTRILDLGTGCGIVAVVLAKEIQEAFIFATDISEEALQIARQNAKRHGVEGKILFVVADLLEPFRGKDSKFDLIVSNPPYISSDTFETLPIEISKFEPRVALDGGVEGMLYVERIIRRAPYYLKSGGWLMLEMDPGQTSRALRIMEESGLYKEQRKVRDYAHKSRVVVAQKRNS